MSKTTRAWEAQEVLSYIFTILKLLSTYIQRIFAAFNANLRSTIFWLRMQKKCVILQYWHKRGKTVKREVLKVSFVISKWILSDTVALWEYVKEQKITFVLNLSIQPRSAEISFSNFLLFEGVKQLWTNWWILNMSLILNGADQGCCLCSPNMSAAKSPGRSMYQKF